MRPDIAPSMGGLKQRRIPVPVNASCSSSSIAAVRSLAGNDAIVAPWTGKGGNNNRTVLSSSGSYSQQQQPQVSKLNSIQNAYKGFPGVVTRTPPMLMQQLAPPITTAMSTMMQHLKINNAASSSTSPSNRSSGTASRERSASFRVAAGLGGGGGRTSSHFNHQQQQQRCHPTPNVNTSSFSNAVNTGTTTMMMSTNGDNCSYNATTTTAAAAGRSVLNSRSLSSSSMSRRKRKPSEVPFAMISPFQRAFYHVLQQSPPSLPPSLLRGLERREPSAVGRVKVMLRVAPPSSDSSSFLEVDGRKKQLTIYEPQNPNVDLSEERKLGVAAPKMFAFDNIFVNDDPQVEVCSKALSDLLPAVVNGSDACLFSYGYSKLGKTHTMIGESDSEQELGIIPCAIWWLFKLINEQKQRTGARFSVRVSATEIAGKSEVLRDLLASHANGTEGCGFSPGIYLCEENSLGHLLQNQCELRAPNAEKAAYFLDAAVAARSTAFKESDGISHFVFTLHVYQYCVDKSGKGGMAGGRSRLYLVDLGGCEKQSQVYSCSKSYRLSMANLGNVILAIFNGQKHVPYKDSKLTQVLREIFGNITCQASMVAHVSQSPDRYTDSLSTIQLASRIHRLRHKKWKHFHSGGGGEGMSEEYSTGGRRNDGLRSSSSDFDYTSSDTCDTVIFVGPPREKAIQEGVEAINEERMIADGPGCPALVSKSGFGQIRRMAPMGNNVQMEELTKPGMLPPFLDYRANQNCYNTTTKNYVNYRPRVSSYQSPVLINNQQPTDGFHWPVHTSGVRRNDEFWVDGPRANMSKLSLNKRTSDPRMRGSGVPLGPETWVDGPQLSNRNELNFLDNCKRAMIERWIEMQADVVIIDYNGSVDEGEVVNEDVAAFARAVDGVAAKILQPGEAAAMLNEADVVSNVDSIVSGEDTDGERTVNGVVDVVPTLRDDVAEIVESVTQILDDYNEEMSLSEQLNETEAEAEIVSSRYSISNDAILEEDEDYEEEIEPTKVAPVCIMMDSWVQVYEEDILENTCHSRSRRCHRRRSAEYEDHPLRILSSESLAFSFSNASRVSWDSGLNAVRQSLMTSRMLDDEDCPFDFGPFEFGHNGAMCSMKNMDPMLEQQSVHSEPATSSVAIATTTYDLRRFGTLRSKSGSLQELSASRSKDSIFKQNSQEHFCYDYDLKLLRRPDGASDPHLDRHPSAYGLTECEGLQSFRKCSSAVDRNRSDDIEANRSKPKSPFSMRDNWCKSPDGCSSPAKRSSSGSNGGTSVKYGGFCCTVVESSQPSAENSDTESVTLSSPVFVDNARNYDDVADDDSDNVDASLLSVTCDLVLDDNWNNEHTAVDHSGVGTLRTIHMDADSGTGSSGCSTKEKDQPSTSSGYDSMPRGSEGSGSASVNDSVSIHSDEALNRIQITSKEQVSSNLCLNSGISSSMSDSLLLVAKDGLESFELKVYDEEDVKRMERWRAMEKDFQMKRRCSRIRYLREKQKELQKEFDLAKRLLMVDESKWSYDLYVERSMNDDDPSFVEALESETLILEKRVAACKSHLMLVTCFDVGRPSRMVESLLSNSTT